MPWGLDDLRERNRRDEQNERIRMNGEHAEAVRRIGKGRECPQCFGAGTVGTGKNSVRCTLCFGIGVP